MPSKATYFKVGLFTVSALLIFGGAVMYFGLSQSFQQLLECESFFNHSVQGLRSGAAVQFRGITVGQVTSASITTFPGESSGRQMIKVSFTISPELITGVRGQDPDEARRFLEREIQAGLRIYLSLQGISGITYLNLDYINERSQGGGAAAAPQGSGAAQDHQLAAGLAPALPGDEALVIPSMPSTILELGDSVTQILRTLKEIDFKTLVGRSTQLVTNLEEITSQLMAGTEGEPGGVTQTLLGAISEARRAAADVGAAARNISAKADELASGNHLKELELTLSDTRKTLNRLDSLMKAPQASLPTTMDNLRVMSENLREFSELARTYPSQILLGGPPPR